MKCKIKKSKLFTNTPDPARPFRLYDIQYNNYHIQVEYYPNTNMYFFELFNADYLTGDFMEVLNIIKENC